MNFIMTRIPALLKKNIPVLTLTVLIISSSFSTDAEAVLFRDKLYLGIDYHFFSIPTYDHNKDGQYKYKIMDLFSLGPNLYYEYKPYMHFAFIPYYSFSSSVIKFKEDYAAPDGLIKKGKEYKLSSQYFVPTLLVKWQVKENCCSFAFCRESMGFSLITGFAYKTLIVQEDKNGFEFQESLPYLVTGFSLKFFNLKNMLLFYEMKAEIPITDEGVTDHPLNIQLFNFSMLYKIK